MVEGLLSCRQSANPNRSPVFRLITIASSGLGSFVIGLWGLKFGFGDSIAGMPTDVVGAIIAALCALAAGGAALSFFAGVDESADYVFSETHFDKLTGLHARTAMVGKIAEAAPATLSTRQAGLPDRHRHRPLQADQRFHRLQPGRRADPRLRRAAAGQPAAKTWWSGASAPANSPCSIPDAKAAMPIDSIVERADRRR